MMRVAAVLHALFSLDPEHDFTTELSAAAALDMVEVCNKHTKIIAARTDTSSSPTTSTNNRHKCIIIYWVIYTTAQTSHLRGKSVIDIGRHCLKIPGRLLDLSTLLDKKKFRAYDNKEGALRGFHALQEDGLELKHGRTASKVSMILEICFTLA